MTTLVVTTDVPSIGLLVGNIVTDDPAVAASSPQARLWPTAYVAGLLSGGLQRYIVQYADAGQPLVVAPASYTQTQLNAAVAAAIAPLQATVSTLQAQVAALQAQIAIGGSGGATSPTNTNTLHSTFAAFGLLGAATN